MQTIPLEFVKERLSKGTAVSTLVSDFLERKISVGATEAEETAVKNVAYTTYGAAGDTMCINLKIQRKAQEELDRVIGPRLPTFDDRESLPYVEAIYREVLRWNPPLLLGIPHYSTEDDHYKGYFIPKNTTVIGNLWCIAHNEDIYSDPYAFNPERFFDSKGRLQEDPTPVYGFRRRICAGKYIASASVWLTLASILTCFDIQRAKDEFGNEVDINDDYEDFTTISYKAPYKSTITPRSRPVYQMTAHELSEN